MTIIILVILAVIAVCLGVFLLTGRSEARTNEQLLVELLQYAMAIGLILVGIFFILLALLFKLNPFW